MLYFVPPGQPEGAPVRAVGPDGLATDGPRRAGCAPSRTSSSASGTPSSTSRTWTGRQHICARAGETASYLASGVNFRPTTQLLRLERDAPAGFDTDREEFVGRCRDPGEPHRRRDAASPRTAALRRAATTSARSATTSTLAPGEETQIVYMHGRDRRAGAIADVVRALPRSPRGRRGVRAPCAPTGNATSTRFTVETPDAEMERDAQRLEPDPVPRQRCTGRASSRPTRPGTGRGMGTRDSAQDTLGTVHNAPDHARGDADDALAPAVRGRPHLAPGLAADGRGRAGPGRRVPGVAAVVLRRPPVADHRRLRLPARDRRLRLSRRAGGLLGRRRATPSGTTCCAAVGLHARRTAARTACRASASPTGTTR